MVSPFTFPVTAKTLNYVGIGGWAAIDFFTANLIPGRHYSRRCHASCDPQLVFHTRRQVVEILTYQGYSRRRRS